MSKDDSHTIRTELFVMAVDLHLSGIQQRHFYFKLKKKPLAYSLYKNISAF